MTTRREDRSVAKQPIPTPESVIGYQMGTARKLPDWQEIVDYFEKLAAASDRVEVEELGKTTLGRPYLAVTISSAENLARRDKLRSILARLYDPRELGSEEEQRLIEQGRTTNFLLLSQHSTEIGATLMSLELASQLASGTDPDTLEILDNTVTVIVPSHNPDGHQMQVEWYRQWLDTEYEGQPMPRLYHHYVGHDNNRDWFMLTQAETRLYAALHNREHPQMVFDMHQMYRDGARFMVPPFIDPLDPNQDPIIQQGFADLGTWIASRMTAEGKAGVATNIIFDNYSPSLAYGNYHGSVDLLSEAASCKLATPVTIEEDDFSKARGFDPTARTWNHPMPWKGGEWTLADIVEYDRIAALAFIEHAARNRRQWLRNYLAVNRRTVQRAEPPFAYLVPEEQDDPITAHELLETLSRGAVEVYRADDGFTADGVAYPAGTRVVPLRQPSGNFAKTLLEIQTYPDLRQYPEGPPKPPYDITGHTLPLQMGVHAIEVKNPFEAELSPVVPERLTGRVIGNGRHGYAISSRTNHSALALNRLLDSGLTVHRASRSVDELDLPAGSLLIPRQDGLDDVVADVSEAAGIDVQSIDRPLSLETVEQGRPRTGVYASWQASIDEGWTRWILEQYGFRFTTLHDNDVKQGDLIDQFETIVLPQQSEKDILEGIPEKNKYKEKYPPEYTGGLGPVGVHSIREFVEDGGTLVALDSACEFAVNQLHLPVRNVVAGLDKDDFYCPGSLLRIIMDGGHPLGFGMRRDEVAVFVNSPAYELADGTAGTIVARYALNNTRLSGWILGQERIAGKGALLEIPLGKGRVVLIAFRAQFRAQARGTYKALFNAIARSGQTKSQLHAK